MSTYITGTLVTVNAEFIDQTTKLPADPTTVTLATSVNGAAPTIYTYGGGVIVKDGTGLYHAELDTTAQPGTWLYEWGGVGNVQAVNVSGFTVVTPPV